MQAIQSIRHVGHSSFSIICCGHRIVVACDAVTHVSKFANEVVIYTLTGNYNAKHSLKEILDALPRNKFYTPLAYHLLGSFRQHQA